MTWLGLDKNAWRPYRDDHTYFMNELEKSGDPVERS